MFKKIGSRTLWIVLIVLLAILVITQIRDKKRGERTFKSEFFELDTALITSFEFYPLSQPDKKISFNKTVNTWELSEKEKKFTPDPAGVRSIIQSLATLKPERVVATETSKWLEYQVDDSTGIQLTVKQGEQIMASLIIGKFSFQQNSRKTTSYVRLQDDNNVYAVDGMLRMVFSPDINNYRNRMLAKLNIGDISSLTFNYPGDSSFIIKKQDAFWFVNESQADSTEVQNYLNQIAFLSSGDFIDEANQYLSAPIYSLVVQGNNMNPLEIRAYEADSINKYFITSSFNRDAIFSGGKSNLYSNIFVPLSKFHAKD
ncbi:DUF4340 domain-containing protein [Bacteroidota bacterium]